MKAPILTALNHKPNPGLLEVASRAILHHDDEVPPQILGFLLRILSYHHQEPILFTTDPFYGNLN